MVGPAVAAATAAADVADTTSFSDCVICGDTFLSPPACEEEEKKIIDCCHIFHRECIDAWLEKKQTCPVCHTYVQVAPEDRRLALTEEELLSLPDSEILPSVRATIEKSRIEKIEKIKKAREEEILYGPEEVRHESLDSMMANRISNSIMPSEFSGSRVLHDNFTGSVPATASEKAFRITKINEGEISPLTPTIAKVVAKVFGWS